MPLESDDTTHVQSSAGKQTIVVFDGVCNLCNGAVQYLLDHDRTNTLLFTSFQSARGSALLMAHGITTAPETIYVLHGNQLFTESQAVLFLSTFLQPAWIRYIGAAAHIIPRPLRDIIYRWIARNRYRWFGKREQCRLPTAEERSRFLE